MEYIDTSIKSKYKCEIIGELGEEYMVRWETGDIVWTKKDKVINREEFVDEGVVNNE